MLSIPYFAGFYEGEACLNQTSPKGFRITIVSTDLDVLERVQKTFGGTINLMKQYKPQHKPCWRWRLGDKQSVSALLQELIPWLGTRRGYDALNALDIIDGIA